MKKLLSLIAVTFAMSMGLSAVAHAAGADTDCAAKSAEKKLAGAAKASFEKKCMADAGAAPSAACEKSAADKKLAGAAKNSHIKKCMADAKAGAAPAAAAGAKPMAADAGMKK
ncbi:hypothetical protein [Polaromonas sp. UC242_47]|uniref:hypothetical protein n=1 Tax=Polaromonas sp. UC242_47 TaxID=3374626 RepID=UPI0037BC1FED